MKLTEKQKRMRTAIRDFKKYVETYPEKYNIINEDKTFILDMVYGIGIALSEDNRYANGLTKFSRELVLLLGGKLEEK